MERRWERWGEMDPTPVVHQPLLASEREGESDSDSEGDSDSDSDSERKWKNVCVRECFARGESTREASTKHTEYRFLGECVCEVARATARARMGEL